jgi:hypothetical protein
VGDKPDGNADRSAAFAGFKVKTGLVQIVHRIGAQHDFGPIGRVIIPTWRFAASLQVFVIYQSRKIRASLAAEKNARPRMMTKDRQNECKCSAAAIGA